MIPSPSANRPVEFGAFDIRHSSFDIAQAHAESEFEKYRIVQDRLFESDFDQMIKKLPPKGDTL